MAVGEILQPYDHDKMYPVYGFGGKVRLPDGSLSPAQHCFPVYGAGLEVRGVEGILQAYRDAKQHVTQRFLILLFVLLLKLQMISTVRKIYSVMLFY